MYVVLNTERPLETRYLKGYEEYRAKQIVLPSGPLDDQHGHGSKRKRKKQTSKAGVMLEVYQ